MELNFLSRIVDRISKLIKSRSIFTDPRDYQILFLATFLGLGVVTRDWSIDPKLIGISIGTCCVTQLLASRIWKPAQNPYLSLKSALITSLGLSLLLRADRLSTMVLAASLAILSKFIFNNNGKHWFNPANFGIIMVLLFTPDAWVSPGQWGADWWYLALFIGTGGIVLGRVGRWDTSMAFLIAYAGLEAARNLWLGLTWDVYTHKLMSGSLLLFALFMITDPRSIPNARSIRVIWAISIASLAFILRNYFYINEAIFVALFAISPMTILLDKLWLAPRFNWGVKSPEDLQDFSFDGTSPTPPGKATAYTQVI